jgi:hypothetical protein
LLPAKPAPHTKLSQRIARIGSVVDIAMMSPSVASSLRALSGQDVATPDVLRQVDALRLRQVEALVVHQHAVQRGAHQPQQPARAMRGSTIVKRDGSSEGVAWDRSLRGIGTHTILHSVRRDDL